MCAIAQRVVKCTGSEAVYDWFDEFKGRQGVWPDQANVFGRELIKRANQGGDAKFTISLQGRDVSGGAAIGSSSSSAHAADGGKLKKPKSEEVSHAKDQGKAAGRAVAVSKAEVAGAKRKGADAADKSSTVSQIQIKRGKGVTVGQQAADEVDSTVEEGEEDLDDVELLQLRCRFAGAMNAAQRCVHMCMSE